MKPRGIAGKCAAGTNLPARGPCPACGAGPDQECPRARLAEAEELERLRAEVVELRTSLDTIGAMFFVGVDGAVLLKPDYENEDVLDVANAALAGGTTADAINDIRADLANLSDTH